MEAKPAKGQGKNDGRDKTNMGLHKMPAVRESHESRLDSFNKRNLFNSQDFFYDLLEVLDISNDQSQFYFCPFVGKRVDLGLSDISSQLSDCGRELC